MFCVSVYLCDSFAFYILFAQVYHAAKVFFSSSMYCSHPILMPSQCVSMCVQYIHTHLCVCS